jgi:hypothetical protein
MGFTFRQHKYHVVAAKARRADGFTFDSRVEMEYYLWLTAPGIKLYSIGTLSRPIHVDIHPKVTLGPGDRVEPDFLVWYGDGRVEFHDVKSTIPHRMQEFRRLQSRWRHPAGPLVGIVWDRKGKCWSRIESVSPCQI